MSSDTSSSISTARIDAGDDWLDDVLRDAGREYRADYIDDDGFTRGVMAQLPEPTTLPAWRRPAVALLWICGIGAAMFSVPAAFEELFRGAVALFVGHRLGVTDIAAAMVLLAAASWSTLVYAMRSD